MALYYLAIISDPNQLTNAKAVGHFICMIGCECHTDNVIARYTNKNVSNMGQHIFRKTKRYPAIPALLRYLCLKTTNNTRTFDYIFI